MTAEELEANKIEKQGERRQKSLSDNGVSFQPTGGDAYGRMEPEEPVV